MRQLLSANCSRRLTRCLCTAQIIGGLGLLLIDAAIGFYSIQSIFGLGFVCGPLLALAGLAGCYRVARRRELKPTADSAACLRLVSNAAALLTSLPCALLLAPAAYPHSATLASAAGYCGFRLPQLPDLQRLNASSSSDSGVVSLASHLDDADADARRSLAAISVGYSAALASLALGGLATIAQLLRCSPALATNDENENADKPAGYEDAVAMTSVGVVNGDKARATAAKPCAL